MQPVPADFPIEKLSGPVVGQIIVGYLLHWGLFGTLSVQLSFPKDRKFIKYLVYGIYIIEFVETILFTHDAFAKFGYGFGDIEALTRMDFNWIAVPIMSAVITFVGQVFYAYRIFILSKSQIVPVFIICVSLASSVAAIITGAYCFPEDNVTEINNRKMNIAVGIWWGASTLCDIIIAVCMTYYLMRSNTSFRRTRIMVSNLIRLTIETGTMTAVVVLLTLILFFVFPHQTFCGTVGIIIPKLYANTILMVLNSRIQIVGGRDTYASSADMSVTTTMMSEITSQSTEGTPPADKIQGQMSVVTMTEDVFNNKLGQTKICHLTHFSPNQSRSYFIKSSALHSPGIFWGHVSNFSAFTIHYGIRGLVSRWLLWREYLSGYRSSIPAQISHNSKAILSIVGWHGRPSLTSRQKECGLSLTTVAKLFGTNMKILTQGAKGGKGEKVWRRQQSSI
ncbi:hypothetical protein IW261DRAFT_1421798 [Armillaria novae-zelandiae]|uniref:DUF6534 domain-containing protein n=1 Tax=Armillaria novae-zelandiae TaxID=153914 RepID=A0AA39P2T1_9AGAR|nr:hypothetical protein IW261DRAFT_1421798 [Armillaria novae-zelandiae]